MLKLILQEMTPEKNPNGYWTERADPILTIIVEDHSQRRKLLEVLAITLGEELPK